MLGKIEGRRRGQQRMRKLDGITDLMDMNLGKLRELGRDGEAWSSATHGVAESETTWWLNNNIVGGLMRLSQTEPLEQSKAHSNHYYYLPSFISLFVCKREVLFIRRNRSSMGFPGSLAIKNPPVNAGDARDMHSIPASGDPLEEKMAADSNILAWKIPWTEEPDELQSMGSWRVLDMIEHTHTQ